MVYLSKRRSAMTIRGMAVLTVVFIFSIGIFTQTADAASACAKTVQPAKSEPYPSVKFDMGGPMKKLGRGMCNFVTFPFEILYQIGKVNNSDGPFAAITYGVVKGVIMTGMRALCGTYEILSFPIPIPEGYKPIMTDLEFFFEGSEW